MTHLDQLVALLDEFDELTSQPADDAKLLRLAGCLDGLSRLACNLPAVNPSDSEAEPPSRGAEYYQRMAANFPMLGLYALQSSFKHGDAEIWTGDAIDDLRDIANDLSAVRWHLDRSSTADALWEYRFGYRSHWGQHYVDLRRVIHDQLFGVHGSCPD